MKTARFVEARWVWYAEMIDWFYAAQDVRWNTDEAGTAGRETFGERGIRGGRTMCLEPLVCSRCGAPLSEKNLLCEYCGTRHMDLSNMSKTISETIADLERESRILMVSDMMERQNRMIIGNIGGDFK